MTPDTVIDIAQEALYVTALLAAPMLLTALGVGLLIGMVQAATQIQEMTLSFIPKLIGVAVALIVAGHWMISLVVNFTEELFFNIPSLIG
jgi:flagellar biosynthetic protein FliQ